MGGLGKKPSRVASREKWANLKTVTPMPHISIAVITPTHLTLFCNGRNRLTVRKGWKKATRRANQRRLWQIIGKDSLSL